MRHRSILLTIALISSFSTQILAQFTTGGPPPPKSPPGTVDRLLESLTFRNLGSAIFGGRILDIESPPGKPNTVYIAPADGGAWKSVNNGTTWTPIFEGLGTSSMGDIAIAPSNPDILYVGTGENTSTRSAHYGDGVYKSTDGGKTWTNVGLKDSKRIGQIVIDPKNPDIVYVASMGYLYKGGGEKGVYKTEDGGKTWNQVLKGDNDTTGFIDIAMDPKNPRVLYAAAHDRLRRAWNIRENGPGAGIYKTTDAGKNWTRLDNGLPKGENVGRIGLAIYPKDPKFVYAFFDMKGTGGGGQLWRSMDAGKTWKKTNDANLSGGTYYCRVFVDPNNPEVIYCPNLNLMRSKDGGKTFQSSVTRAHVDWHSVWIDPNDSDHMRAGCDGGLYFTYDGWANCEHIDNLPIGQFYSIAVDNAVPYHVMGGTQDNGSWRGPSQTRNRGGIFNFQWENVLGGDGFYNVPHPIDTDIVYSSSQFGSINRVDMSIQNGRLIRPRETGQRANWMAPIVVSPHNPDTVYWGGNKLYKSTNRGDSWQAISPDLTTNDPEKISPKGNVPHCTITTIDVSRKKPGVIWVGTDDGNVYMTQDDGANWKLINGAMADHPANYWVSRVFASPHDEATAWVALTGFREDDWSPYLWKTTDSGKTWTRVKGLPDEQISVIKQDSVNPNLLFVGTEQSCQVSFDGGDSWHKLPGLPTVSCMDVVIQERENELVIGTHGRGFFIADITPFRQLTADIQAKTTHLFKPTRALDFMFASNMFEGFKGAKTFSSPNPQFGAQLWYWLKTDAANDPKIEVLDVAGNVIATMTGTKYAGLNKVTWGLRANGQPAVGKYLVRLTNGTEVTTQVLNVEAWGKLSTSTTQDSLEPGEGGMDEASREQMESLFGGLLKLVPLPFGMGIAIEGD